MVETPRTTFHKRPIDIVHALPGPAPGPPGPARAPAGLPRQAQAKTIEKCGVLKTNAPRTRCTRGEVSHTHPCLSALNTGVSAGGNWGEESGGGGRWAGTCSEQVKWGSWEQRKEHEKEIKEKGHVVRARRAQRPDGHALHLCVGLMLGADGLAQQRLRQTGDTWQTREHEHGHTGR